MKSMADPILIFITCASLGEGEAIARRLLDLRLIACATLGSHVHSYYSWKDERQESTEYPLLLKTHRDLLPAVEVEVRRLHSYELPELIAVPIVAGSEAYLGWLADSLAQVPASSPNEAKQPAAVQAPRTEPS